MRQPERLATDPTQDRAAAPKPRGSVAPEFARVLELQRSAGNAAVAGLVARRRTLQRAPLPSAAAALGPLAGDPQLAQVLAALQAHQAVAADAGRLGDRMRALVDLDRAIYAVLGGARLRKLRDAPQGELLLRLLDESEAEHAQVVQDMRAAGGVEIPVDVRHLPPLRRARAAQLWGMLHGGLGELRVQGPPAYTRPIFSQLARLLGTAAGVSLLDMLVTGTHGHQVTILDTLPAAANPAAAPAHSSFAVPADAAVPNAAYEFDIPAATPAGLLEIADARGILDALSVGRPGFVLEGRNYVFSAGTDALVVIRPHAHATPDAVALSGVHHEAILNPGWITLGHELGHAVRIAGGAGAGMGTFHQFESKTENERHAWTKAEEFVNIAGLENPLRAQGGLTERRGHKTQPAVQLADRKQALIDQVQARAAHLGCTRQQIYALPGAGPAINQLLISPTADIQNDLAFQGIQKLLTAWLAGITPAMLAALAAAGGH